MTQGKSLERGDWPWLVLGLLGGCLALALFACTAHRFTGGQEGVPLDDAWIHFQLARNLARGDGLSFNPGQPTSGSTAPLWTLLLAGVYVAGGEFPVSGQVLSAICFLITLAATYVLGKQVSGSRWAAWLGSVVVALNGRMVWAGLSGLETCLFAALSLLAISAHLHDRALRRCRLRTAALFGLGALSRPEGLLLFVLALADHAWNTLRAVEPSSHQTFRTQLLNLRRFPFLPTLLFALIVLPALVFSWRTSGHLLPNTYHAKATFDLRPDLTFLSLAARYLILDNPLLLPFFILGLAALSRRAALLSMWSAGLPLVYAFFHAALYQHGRYLIPLIPCNAIVGLAGLLEGRRLAAQRGWRWQGRQVTLAAVIALLVICGTGWRLPHMAREYAWNVDNINAMHVTLGHWIAENTPPDAILALNDIGAITYISQRQIIDLAGLVTPEIVPLLRDPNRDVLLAGLMAERDVQYAVLFPNWFPGLAVNPDLQPVHQVTLAHNTIAGGETMVVYRARWQR